MGVSLSVRVDQLYGKIQKLTRQYRQVIDQRDALQIQVADLKRDIDELKRQLNSVKLDNQFLTVSHRLAQSPNALAESRKVIAALIRDIDKCIAQLKE